MNDPLEIDKSEEPRPMKLLEKEGEGPGHGLTDKQRRAAELLVEGMKIIDAARELKVTRTTIWTWRRLSEFETYQQRLRWDQSYESAERRRALEDKILDVLLKAVDEGDAKVAVNVAKLLWK